LILCLLALSFSFLLLKFQPDSYAFTYNHTLTCAVSLLTGALLANLKTESPKQITQFLRNLTWAPWVALAGCLALCYLVQNKTLGEGYLIFIRPFICIGGFYLIGRMALKPFKGISGKIFMNKYIRGVGKISYGVYMYHMLVFVLFAPYLNQAFGWVVSHSLFDNSVLKYVKYNPSLFLLPVLAAIVIAVSWLSYRLFELPFLKMKKAFQ
jgi:peptidoglycan/LPS O-acetylase OafA/YrhL